MNWQDALDIRRDIKQIVRKLNLFYIDCGKIVCFRSYGSKTRARARIWSFPKVWQQALKLPPHYIIEVISERFDRMSPQDKQRTLIHELLHIPKNFSGALSPHKTRYSRIDQQVDILYRKLIEEK